MNILHSSTFLASSPLDQFEVTSLIGLNAPIFGYLNLTLSNLGLYSLIVLFIVLGLHYFGNNDSALVPSK
jgi:F-type H+-transporting ATPase subunit a